MVCSQLSRSRLDRKWFLSVYLLGFPSLKCKCSCVESYRSLCPHINLHFLENTKGAKEITKTSAWARNTKNEMNSMEKMKNAQQRNAHTDKHSAQQRQLNLWSTTDGLQLTIYILELHIRLLVYARDTRSADESVKWNMCTWRSCACTKSTIHSILLYKSCVWFCFFFFFSVTLPHSHTTAIWRPHMWTVFASFQAIRSNSVSSVLPEQCGSRLCGCVCHSSLFTSRTQVRNT